MTSKNRDGSLMTRWNHNWWKEEKKKEERKNESRGFFKNGENLLTGSLGCNREKRLDWRVFLINDTHLSKPNAKKDGHIFSEGRIKSWGADS